MNKAPRLFDAGGRYLVSVNARSARIAIDAPGDEVSAECAELGPFKGQLKAAVLQAL